MSELRSVLHFDANTSPAWFWRLPWRTASDALQCQRDLIALGGATAILYGRRYQWEPITSRALERFRAVMVEIADRYDNDYERTG